jgi:hypothetical protein
MRILWSDLTLALLLFLAVVGIVLWSQRPEIGAIDPPQRAGLKMI